MKAFCLALQLVLAASSLSALDLWRYPEAADKNALFLDVLAASLSFDGFSLPPPVIQLEYLLPIGLPFSIGAFFRAPNPNLNSFGIRAAYHIDLASEYIDLYVVYVFDFGFVRNDLLIAYGDEPRESRYYDFRAGARYRFGRFFGLYIETGYKLQSVHFGLSVKLN